MWEEQAVKGNFCTPWGRLQALSESRGRLKSPAGKLIDIFNANELIPSGNIFPQFLKTPAEDSPVTLREKIVVSRSQPAAGSMGDLSVLSKQHEQCLVMS